MDVDAARALSAHGRVADKATNERRVRDMREMVSHYSEIDELKDS